LRLSFFTVRHHAVPQNQEKEDWYIYTLQSTKIYKGKIDSEFRVKEYNDTGRAGFFWRKGNSYLLFLQQGEDGTWSLYGCGNSRPLKPSNFALGVLESLPTRAGGSIRGLILEGNSTNPVQGLTIEVRSDKRSYRVVTNKDGKFTVHVEAGLYTVRAVRPGWSFKRDEVESYEDPSDIQIENGGCAQVVMTGEPTN
jgi:hypothetical protein